ncbi:amino acid ABC transporter permease [Leptolyngbya sp. FACHB-261]|uniref:amino acid ABC transporter permease n=1 Tax=Leptolyngbya sp. FACHB-261 TaxID=2692806 RepID=UPI001685FDAA|nr:amino acid ABC transporter permease [Leptolyngbya sp. FACHB-261]MBD2102887.1 amino acid ABC transporter permease [Leptolyngbya sp. FACHB-261]
MKILDTFFNWRVRWDSLPLLLEGLRLTVLLGGAIIFLSTLLGLVVALVRLYAPRPLRFLAVIFIDVMRAMPLLVMLVLVYYALPFVGLTLAPFTAALWAISLVGSAYAAEIFRAGIQAIPRGQLEAAHALSLNYWSLMGDVVLPQAMRIVIPPLTNNAISLIKDTALASVVAMPELLKQATQQQALAANPTPLIGAALLYLLLLLPLVRLVVFFEQRFRAESRS